MTFEICLDDEQFIQDQRKKSVTPSPGLLYVLPPQQPPPAPPTPPPPTPPTPFCFSLLFPFSTRGQVSPRLRRQGCQSPTQRVRGNRCQGNSDSVARHLELCSQLSFLLLGSARTHAHTHAHARTHMEPDLTALLKSTSSRTRNARIAGAGDAIINEKSTYAASKKSQNTANDTVAIHHTGAFAKKQRQPTIPNLQCSIMLMRPKCYWRCFIPVRISMPHD